MTRVVLAVCRRRVEDEDLPETLSYQFIYGLQSRMELTTHRVSELYHQDGEEYYVSREVQPQFLPTSHTEIYSHERPEHPQQRTPTTSSNHDPPTYN
jgi:hypothetical protein